MRISGSLLIVLLSVSAAGPALLGQTQIIRGDFYPAEFEFEELGKIQAQETIKDASAILKVTDGLYFADVGFQSYSSRKYQLRDDGVLAIEIAGLLDSKAPYSLLTLLRKSEIRPGPPGEFYLSEPNDLILIRGNYYVRIRANVSGDLIKRIANSISNRIGQRETTLPPIIKHFPKEGFDSNSLHYFLGPKSYAAFSTLQLGGNLTFTSGVELAQANYSLNNESGTLSLFSFPTHELAEAYQSALESQSAAAAQRIYFKRAGPLLGILQGSFAPGTADQLLGSIHFTYAIKWIYDKDNQGKGKTIWGVPMPILHTVVRSVFLIIVLALASIIVGAAFAFFRFWLRNHAPQNILDRPDRTEMIRLKINEK
jgi:hypothetical protein